MFSCFHVFLLLSSSTFYLLALQFFLLNIMFNLNRPLQFYKHNRMRSFARQLNQYSFWKGRSASCNDGEVPAAVEYNHPNFLLGHPDLLVRITRRPIGEAPPLPSVKEFGRFSRISCRSFDAKSTVGHTMIKSDICIDGSSSLQGGTKRARQSESTRHNEERRHASMSGAKESTSSGDEMAWAAPQNAIGRKPASNSKGFIIEKSFIQRTSNFTCWNEADTGSDRLTPSSGNDMELGMQREIAEADKNNSLMTASAQIEDPTMAEMCQVVTKYDFEYVIESFIIIAWACKTILFLVCTYIYIFVIYSFVSCRNSLGALFPEVYLRDVLGCSVTLNKIQETVPCWALPFMSGNMPIVQMPTIMAQSDPLTAAVSATVNSSELLGVPPSPSCLSVWRTGFRKPSVHSATTTTHSSTMLHSELSNCGASSSIPSCRSSFSSIDDGDRGGGSIGSDHGEYFEELDIKTSAEELKARAFLEAAQIGEAGRGFFALYNSS